MIKQHLNRFFGRREDMSHHDLADYAVAAAGELGASYCEARFETTRTNSFMLKNGIPEISGFEQRSGIGIRLQVKGSLGFVSTNIFTKKKIREMLSRTIRSISANQRLHEKLMLSEEKPHRKTYEVKQKRNVMDLSSKEKLAYLLETEKAIIATGIDCPGRYLSLADSYTEEYLVTSEGTQILAKVPKVLFDYYLTVKAGGKSLQRSWTYGNTGGYEFVDKWDIPQLMEDEVRISARVLAKGKKPPKGVLDVVTGPQVTGIMVHESAGHPYEADRIFGREAAQAGESFITLDMLGGKIGSTCVTVVDDPTLKNSNGFYLYDNEGVKARRKVLIKDGKINEFLHNRETAARMGLMSNGSSRATDFDKESIVRMSNTFMLPGKYSKEELIAGVKKGVFMNNFMEWNIDDKRLNQRYVGAEAYLIENGELTHPVLNPILEITTPALYSAVDAVGNNTEYHTGSCGKGEPMQGIPVWFGGPSIRLRNVRLS